MPRIPRISKIPSYLDIGEVRHPFTDLPSERENIVRRYSVVGRVIGAPRLFADVVAQRSGKQGSRAAGSSFRLQVSAASQIVAEIPRGAHEYRANCAWYPQWYTSMWMVCRMSDNIRLRARQELIKLNEKKFLRAFTRQFA